MDTIIERRGTKPKLTIAPTQIRIKFPEKLSDAECLNLLSFFNKIVNDIGPVMNTLRGYYLIKQDTIVMWKGKGMEKISIKKYSINDSFTNKI